MGKIVDNIMPKAITSSIGTKINKGLEKAGQSKFMKDLANKQLLHETQKAPLPFLLGPVASIITKDALGCICYVYNDLTNKKIPPEQRPFSAAMDLANGVTSIAVMALMDNFLSPAMKKGYENSTRKYFSDANVKKIADSVAKKGGISAEKALEQTKAKMKTLDQSTISGFSSLSKLVIVGIIAKRVVSPLISTPLASAIKPYVQKIFGKKKEDTKSQKLNTKA